MRTLARLLSERRFSTSTRALAGAPKPPARPTSSAAYPILSFVGLAAASVWALTYITKKRDVENRTSTREKRTPIPNPLIPAPRTEQEKHELAKLRA